MQYFLKDPKAASHELASTTEKASTSSGDERPFPEPLSREDSIVVLQQNLLLITEDVSSGDPTIFLSIDVEGTEFISEFGISIFYTKDLRSSMI
ncbi:uncharacterized protein PAC_09395 [Phialocephala subalpina]|uniref:Uncharacterized protein n=1 Tax=Phialocephala subalpina TaxID=576137 RepID=A0A1L7X3A4_9HELO|nr:uncharacterized protein PAC_09395 [Phialocephala subalpina]